MTNARKLLPFIMVFAMLTVYGAAISDGVMTWIAGLMVVGLCVLATLFVALER